MSKTRKPEFWRPQAIIVASLRRLGTHLSSLIGRLNCPAGIRRRLREQRRAIRGEVHLQPEPGDDLGVRLIADVDKLRVTEREMPREHTRLPNRPRHQRRPIRPN